MKSPAILQGHLTLESLLAACVHEESGEMRDEALAKVPVQTLATPDGPIWLASSAMLVGVSKLQKETVIRSRSVFEIGPDFYDGNPRARIDRWAVEQKTGDYTRLLPNYTTITIPSLAWYAFGDMKEACRLLSTQRWLGKRRGSGFGEIAQINAKEMVCNPLVDQAGMVRRPIPANLIQHITRAAPLAEQVVMKTVCKHPAWLYDEELCAVPPSKNEKRLFVEEIAY